MRPSQPARTAARLARRAVEILLVERRYTMPPRGAIAAPAPLHEHHKAYAPTPWRLIRHLLRPEEVRDTDVFVDFGCGTGRVMLEAGEAYPFRRLVGVEAIPELAAAARTLLQRNEHRLRGCPWEIVTADARDYDVPDDVTVAYFFDPFTGSHFEAVLARLEASVDRRPRRVRIVYLVPTEIDLLARSSRIVPVRRGRTGWLRAGGRSEYFVGDLIPAV